ncbi:DNA alkylation repair protein, partial [Tetragenococcus muriaticus]
MKEIMSELQSYPSEKYKENVVRLGIPRESSMGVPMISIRKMARKVNKNNQLAWQLWETDYHEAKLLATFLSEVNKLTYQDINRLMSDVISWDLCDHLCKELIFKLHNY